MHHLPPCRATFRCGPNRRSPPDRSGPMPYGADEGHGARGTELGGAGQLVTRHAGLCERTDGKGQPPGAALQRADVIDDVPAVHLLDAIVAGHEHPAVADHAEDVAVGPPLHDVRHEAHRGHAVPRGRSVALPKVAVTDRAVELKVQVAAGEPTPRTSAPGSSARRPWNRWRWAWRRRKRGTPASRFPSSGPSPAGCRAPSGCRGAGSPTSPRWAGA